MTQNHLAHLTATSKGVATRESASASSVTMEMLVKLRSAPMDAHLKEFATVKESVNVIQDFLAKIVRETRAHSIVLVMESAILASALVSLGIEAMDVSMRSAPTCARKKAFVMVPSAIASLDGLDLIAGKRLVPTIALEMVNADSEFATAVRDGKARRVIMLFAPTIVLEMVNASTDLAAASTVSRALIAQSLHVPMNARTMAAASTMVLVFATMVGCLRTVQ